MVELEGLKRSIHVFIYLLLLSLILFAVFSFITIRTDVNIINSLVNSLGTGETLSMIRVNLAETYRIAVLETFVLGGSVVAALIAINYLIGLYFDARGTSFIDSLTKIYNKRALYRILDNEKKRAKRFKHPLTIIMIDVDYFKVYNDKNGHVAGDIALKRIAGILSRSVRDVDTVARYGGEEFTVILPETSYSSASTISERIRKTIESTKFRGEEKLPKRNLTVSLGLATFQGKYRGKKRMIESADEMLYAAKKEGRNKLKKVYLG